MTKYMVTGGAGFIGSHVVEILAEDEENEIMVLDNFSTGDITNLPPKNNMFVRTSDIIWKNDVEDAFDRFKPDVVIHLAAQAAITTAQEDPRHDLNVNGQGTLNMLLWSQKYEVKRFVYASTSAVYGDKLLTMSEHETKLCPDNYYGVSKLTGEMYAHVVDVPSTILRFGNVYGPRQVPIGENQVIARMMRHLMFQEEFYIFGDGHQKRDFVYVTDVARAVALAANDQTVTMRQVYNVAGGQSYSVNAVAKKLAELWGYQDKWQYKRSRVDERKNASMNIDAAFAGLGWSPMVDLREGLNKTIHWWKNNA